MQIDNPPFVMKEGNSALALTFYEIPVRAVVLEKDKPERFVYHKGIMCRIETPAMKHQTAEEMIELYNEAGDLIKKKIWMYVNGQPVYYTDRFKAAYTAWKERRGTESMGGTPLETWPRLDVALVAHFKNEGIRSLEQLAAVSDSNLHVLGMNGRAWRDGAKKHLEGLAQNAPFEEMKADYERLKALLEAMQNVTHEPKKRGRKPRVEAEAA